MSVPIILAGLFGLVLGSGATFAYLVLDELWTRNEVSRTNKQLLKALKAAASGKGKIEVKKIVAVKGNKRKKYDTQRPANRDRG